MQIALIQADIAWCDRQENYDRLDKMLAGTSHADLYLLPEMFPTGFVTSPEGIAEPAQGPSFEWMKSKAAAMNAAIAGSVSVTEKGRYYNRMYFVCPDGSWYYYDKRHLFQSEAAQYTPGNRRVIAQWKGMKFLLATCYDLRFPVWLRNRKDYDAILIGASWPASRRKAWDALLVARAIENECYVAAVDRTGSDPDASYNGGSVLLNCMGEKICSCPDGEISAVVGNVETENVRDFRALFPALDDADNFNFR